MSETLIVKSILGALQLKYKNRAKFWRNNTGATKTETGGFVRFGALGSPDILGILQGGRFVALEVKTAKGRTSPAQESWLAEALQLGAVAGVARSIDDAFALIDKALAGEAVASKPKPA
jgi:hypothetical protein